MIEDQIVNNPKYMIVGEAPGEEEVRENKPFVGKSGKLLDQMLQTIGINREGECYVTNVIQERPPKNNFGVFYLDSKRSTPNQQLQDAWICLLGKIQKIKPKLIIGLGSESLRALTKLQGIETWRGTIHSIEGIKTICTFHPAALLRSGGESNWYKPAMLMDLLKAKKEAENGLGMHTPTVTIIREPDKLESWFVDVTKFNDNFFAPFVSFDIETSMEHGQNIRCIGFSFNSNEAVCVPFDKENVNPLDTIAVIKKWMTSSEIHWIAQNGYGFDINFIKNCWGFEVTNFYLDTMVAHHVIEPEMPHSLAALTSFYTRIPYYKDTIDTDLYHYNGLDAVATWIVAQQLISTLKTRKLWNLYREYYHPLLTPLREMNWRGIHIDKEYQRELRESLKQEIERTQIEIDEEVSTKVDTSGIIRRIQRIEALCKSGRKTIKLPDRKTHTIKSKRISSLLTQTNKLLAARNCLNARSSKQVGDYLYKTLGLPPQKSKGKVTTDETAINKLFIKTGNPFLKKLISLRRAENNMSKYGKMSLDKNDCVRTTYSFAETGRLRSGRYDAK